MICAEIVLRGSGQSQVPVVQMSSPPWTILYSERHGKGEWAQNSTKEIWRSLHF